MDFNLNDKVIITRRDGIKKTGIISMISDLDPKFKYKVITGDGKEYWKEECSLRKIEVESTKIPAKAKNGETIMKNKLNDLNNILFEQLERLNDDDLTDDELNREIKKAKAISSISHNIVESGAIALQAKGLQLKYELSDEQIPDTLKIGN